MGSITQMGSMRAVVQDSYGSVDVLRLDRIDKPEVAANEVLVSVRAAGLDRGTEHLLTGKPGSTVRPGWVGAS